MRYYITAILFVISSAPGRRMMDRVAVSVMEVIMWRWESDKTSVVV